MTPLTARRLTNVMSKQAHNSVTDRSVCVMCQSEGTDREVDHVEEGKPEAGDSQVSHYVFLP